LLNTTNSVTFNSITGNGANITNIDKYTTSYIDTNIYTKTQADGLFSSGFVGAILPSSPAPTQNGLYSCTQSGTYTNFGGEVVSLSNQVVSIAVEGAQNNVFSQIITPIGLTIDSEPTLGSTNAVASGGVKTAIENKFETLINVVNLFNKLGIIEGKFVNTSNGNISSDATSSVSPIIEVEADSLYFLSGRDSGRRECVFYDVSDTHLKPIDVNGVEQTDYKLPDENGVFKTPPNAVSVQFTTKFVGTGTYDNIQLSKGSEQQSYTPFGEGLIKSELIPIEVGDTSFSVTIISTGFTFRTSFDSVYDILVEFRNSGNNLLYNIFKARLLNKEDPDNASGTLLNGYGGDESAPIQLNGYYIGGNHGLPTRIIESVGHGKTLADVGALYSSANSKNVVILEIVDVDNIMVTERLIHADNDYVVSNITSPLTYQSNGNSTSDINFTDGGSTLHQHYLSISNRSQSIKLDDVVISAEATYKGNKLEVVEGYSVIDLVDMIDKVVSNRPVGGYLSQPTLDDADNLVDFKNIFNIQEQGKISILNSFFTRKEIDLGYFGITQTHFKEPSWATSIKRYFPDVLPISNNGNTFDFRLTEDIATPIISGTINFESDVWEDNEPTRRVVDLLSGGGLEINYNLGLLPLGGNRIDLVDNAFFMTSSKKLYPRFVDSAVETLGVLPANTLFNGVAFRGWSKPQGIATNNFSIKNGGKYYLFLDYHVAGIDKITMPKELIGKSITVNKSKNVNVKNTIVVDELIIEVVASTPLYGYAEIEIY